MKRFFMATMTIFNKKKLHRKQSSHAGFSLLELLVVVSIMGILMAMGTVAFMTAQQRARDGKRRADMQQVQKAFEQYFAANGQYGTTAQMSTAEYLPGGLPADPRPSNAVYRFTRTTTSFCGCALLEAAGSGNASNNSCTYAASGNYYCVSNLQ